MDNSGYKPFPNQGRRNFYQRQIEVPLFVWALSLPGGRRVLEVGCGRGVALPVIARLLTPSVLIGLDIESPFLREAKGTTGDPACAHFLNADLRELPFPDACFDVVVDFGTSYHVSKGGLALSEVARVLVPGGIFATESKLAQVLAHPIRTRGRRLQFQPGSGLRRHRHAGLWVSYVKRP